MQPLGNCSQGNALISVWELLHLPLTTRSSFRGGSGPRGTQMTAHPLVTSQALDGLQDMGTLTPSPQAAAEHPNSHSWPLYTCNTGCTKTWFGIPGCFCESCNKTCICKASCSYKLIPLQHNLAMLIEYIIYIKWLTDSRPKILRLWHTHRLCSTKPFSSRIPGPPFAKGLD